MIITVHIDESGTHDSPLMIMAGFVGKLGQWVDFEKKWRRVLGRYEIDHFHSHAMRQSKPPFRGWPRTKKAAFMADVAKVADRHTVFGFTTMLRKADYERHYIAGQRPRETQLDSMYGLCFRRSLSLICESTPYYLKRNDLEISFVLEEGHKNAGDVVRIFNEIKTSGPPDIAGLLRTISFGDKVRFPGLQGADANAYIAFQNERDGPAIVEGPPIESLKDAQRRINGRSPVFRDHITLEMMQEARATILEQIEARKTYGRRTAG